MRYFAYGSNIDPRLMSEACPDAEVLGPGRLDGYRLEFNVYSDRWEGGAANVEPDERGHVWGVVWEVTEEDMDRLDTFIGHPSYFRREEVPVVLRGEEVACATYRVAHQHGYVRPSDSYVHRIRNAMRLQGLPPEALDMLERAARPPYPRIST
jgi:gamma-glutamylcyclotransferase